MSRNRNNKSTHFSFEGRYATGRFLKITLDMRNSRAWKELNVRQRGLYLEMKAEFRVTKNSDGSIEFCNEHGFKFPKATWGPLYNNNYLAFRDDLKALVERGFIRLVLSGKKDRKPNTYTFSSDWQNWQQSIVKKSARREPPETSKSVANAGSEYGGSTTLKKEVEAV